MECINRLATVNLDTPHGITPKFRFVFSKEDGSEYDLGGKDVSFEIFDDKLVLLFSAAAGISVVGNVIDLQLEGEDYSLVREFPRHQYKYSLTVGGDFRVQGRYRSMVRAGPVCAEQETVRIVVHSIAVQVTLAATVGPQGPQGPPGTARAEYVDLPASAELSGMFRRSEGANYDLLEQCRLVGAGTWAWCLVSKNEWQ